jgi:hypothetical protein
MTVEDIILSLRFSEIKAIWDYTDSAVGEGPDLNSRSIFKIDTWISITLCTLWHFQKFGILKEALRRLCFANLEDYPITEHCI